MVEPPYTLTRNFCQKVECLYIIITSKIKVVTPLENHMRPLILGLAGYVAFSEF